MNNIEFKKGQVLTGIFNKECNELIIDMTGGIRPHYFEYSDRLYGKTICNDDFYFQTACIINGKLRFPVYNNKMDPTNGSLSQGYKVSTIIEFVDDLGMLCESIPEVHEIFKKQVEKKQNVIEHVIEYLSLAINALNSKYFDIFKDNKVKWLANLENEMNINEEIVKDIGDKLQIKSLLETIEILKHNYDNPKMKKRYELSDEDLEVLCNYSLYLPIRESNNIEEFLDVRKFDRVLINEEFEQIIKQEDNKIGVITSTYERLLSVLKNIN